MVQHGCIGIVNLLLITGLASHDTFYPNFHVPYDGLVTHDHLSE